MTSNISHFKYDNNPEWDNIEIKQKWSTWGVTSHSEGDVEIECHTSLNGSEHLFLNQLELKEFIEFLQSKIK